ncbi:ribonuclease P protein subunit p30-like [Protopterus annectens]|uniref:ribonuclease P protein subunit p30-like n=1 Tax=Protopterus annectens TaxID=7888 RepID=UPI001CFA6DB0|nr:ribonuclease P protein subunit p30-like [Protopterus annectens]
MERILDKQQSVIAGTSPFMSDFDSAADAHQESVKLVTVIPTTFSIKLSGARAVINVWIFFNLSNKTISCYHKLESIVEAAAHLGYSTVAVNHVHVKCNFELIAVSGGCYCLQSVVPITLQNFEKEAKKEIAKPLCQELFQQALQVVQDTAKPVIILTRLTTVASDPSQCTEMGTAKPFKILYDTVSVFPKTETLFHTACLNLNMDLIYINVTEKQPFYFKWTAVNAAISRGIYSELVYTPAIRDSLIRRYTISNALSLMQSCKGKVCV